MSAPIGVSILGASGYVGGELMRLLVQHPRFELRQVTSERSAGQPVRAVHPHLRGWCDLRFVSAPDLEPVELLVTALPHGRTAARIEELLGLCERLVDCSADFRLGDPAEYERVYGAPHPAPRRLAEFVYGLPEAHRGRIEGARLVSGVGCNATASNLALLPFVRAGLVDPAAPVVVDLKVGSSEAGRAATAAGSHAERSRVVRSFAPTGHRHGAEVRQVTGLVDVDLSVTSVEMVRGALATAHLRTAEPVTEKDLWGAFRESYGADPFVRIVHDRGGPYRHPEPRLVTGTNHADVGWALAEGGRRVVALCALDNLMKGAAGTAVQCANLMFGLPEAQGLGAVGLHPC